MSKTKHKLSDKTKINLFRFWFVGAIYFLIAFGTNLGNMISPLDLIFFLGISIGILNLIVFNPIIYRMFDIKRNGRIINQEYFKRKIKVNVLMSLLEIFKCLFIVLMIYFIYQSINEFINKAFELDKTTIMLKGEPILFSILFLCFYNIIDSIANNVRNVLTSVKSQTNIDEKNEESNDK